MLRFSPNSDTLVSGSADNTVRIVTIPIGLGATCECYPPSYLQHPNSVVTAWGSWLLFIVALLVVLFAILAQQWFRGMADVLSDAY